MAKPTNHNLAVFRSLAWSVLIGLFVCGSSWAQNLIFHLKNGDRITGRIVSETTNQVVVATTYADHLVIPRKLIARKDPVPQPALPKAPATGIASELVLTNVPSMAQQAGGAAKPPPPGKPAETPASTEKTKTTETAAKPAEPAAKPAEPAPKPAQPAEVAAKPPEPSAFRKFISEWNGEAQLGANLGFGNKERQTLTGRIKLTHNHAFTPPRAMRNILDYDVAYGMTDNVLSDNRMQGNWKLEYDISKHFLAYSATRAGYDEIRQIDFEYDLGPGMGYKWLVLTNFVLKTELGGNYQEQFFAGDEKTSRYSLRLAEDSWWQITPKVRWDQRLEYFPAIEEFGSYRIRFESNLSYLLKQNLTLTLNLVDLYDTGVPDGVSRNDLQVRSLLGIKF
jgi:putative salt-induced outer membrane protein YdiY